MTRAEIAEELRLDAGVFHRLGLRRELPQLLDLVANLLSIPSQRDGLEHGLESFAVPFLHFIHLVRIWQVGRGQANKLLSAFESLFESPSAVLERPAHRVGAGSQPALVEGHQEPDRPGARVLVGRHVHGEHRRPPVSIVHAGETGSDRSVRPETDDASECRNPEFSVCGFEQVHHPAVRETVFDAVVSEGVAVEARQARFAGGHPQVAVRVHVEAVGEELAQRGGGGVRERARWRAGGVPGVREVRVTGVGGMAEVLVVVEHSDGLVKKVTLEMLTLARELSALGEPAAVVLGSPGTAAGLTDKLAECGAGKIYAAESPEIDEFLVAPKASVLASLIARSQPAAVLLGATQEGKEIAGRLAVKLDNGRLADVSAVAADGTATQVVFAGSTIVTSKVTRGLPLATLRPNSLTPTPAPATPASRAATRCEQPMLSCGCSVAPRRRSRVAISAGFRWRWRKTGRRRPTATRGRPSLNGSQLAPPLVDRNTPISVPAKRFWVFAGSIANALTGTSGTPIPDTVHVGDGDNRFVVFQMCWPAARPKPFSAT